MFDGMVVLIDGWMLINGNYKCIVCTEVVFKKAPYFSKTDILFSKNGLIKGGFQFSQFVTCKKLIRLKVNDNGNNNRAYTVVSRYGTIPGDTSNV